MHNFNKVGYLAFKYIADSFSKYFLNIDYMPDILDTTNKLIRILALREMTDLYISGSQYMVPRSAASGLHGTCWKYKSLVSTPAPVNQKLMG